MNSRETANFVGLRYARSTDAHEDRMVYGGQARRC